MTGTFIEARLLADEPRVAITRLMRMGTDPAQLLAPIGTGMVRATHDRFRQAEDPQGAAWKPLNPAYDNRGQRDGSGRFLASTKRGAGILRGAAMSGGLMGSITRDVQGYEVAVGTAKVYGAIHQFGGIIRPRQARRLAFRLGGRLVLARQVTIPARPFLGWGAAEDEVVMEVTEALFDRAISAGRAAGARGGGRLF